MVANILHEFGGRGFATLLGLLIGSSTTFFIARWRRHKQHMSVLQGDARDTVVIHHHIVERENVTDPGTGEPRDVPKALRIRIVGQAEVPNVIPNGHLERILMQRAFEVTPTDTLISMEGIEGSYLLETLTGFVCDRVGTRPFEHDLYVMAPCCEPKELARHQPIVVNLIARKDLKLFHDWNDVLKMRVEHSMDGARALTLVQMAKRFDAEQAKIALMRQEGKRVTYVETMYLLDLALDKRTAEVATKPIPWGRYEKTIQAMGLE